jgi:5-methylcytosine-specific restriction endonuclease McrA
MMYPKPIRKRKSNRNPIPQKLLDEVWERDKGICQYCGIYCGNVIPHHCVYGGTGRKRIHRIENLITLCLDCHSEAHSSKEMREWTYAWSRQRYGNMIDTLLADKWSSKKG